MTETGAPLVVVDNVQKHYGDFQALTDIDLTVNSGEVVVVIGPSGSGKSTLCRTQTSAWSSNRSISSRTSRSSRT
jgi:glutamate transport system ATP-binding protein